eukprot:991095_1
MAEAQRKKDVQGEIHTLQRKFTDDTVISSIGREILCVGELRVVSGRNASFFEFILLSDLLLQAQKSLDESLKLVAKFDMKFLTVAECKDSSTDFYIYNKSTPILLRASSMKEMIDWVRRIKEASRAASESLSSSKGRFLLSDWVADDSSNVCAVCNVEFSFFQRKHHCRRCGNLVCAGCSPGSVIFPHLDRKMPQKVCSECEKDLSKTGRSSRKSIKSYHSSAVHLSSWSLLPLSVGGSGLDPDNLAHLPMDALSRVQLLIEENIFRHHFKILLEIGLKPMVNTFSAPDSEFDDSAVQRIAALLEATLALNERCLAFGEELSQAVRAFVLGNGAESVGEVLEAFSDYWELHYSYAAHVAECTQYINPLANLNVANTFREHPDSFGMGIGYYISVVLHKLADISDRVCSIGALLDASSPEHGCFERSLAAIHQAEHHAQPELESARSQWLGLFSDRIIPKGSGVYPDLVDKKLVLQGPVKLKNGRGSEEMPRYLYFFTDIILTSFTTPQGEQMDMYLPVSMLKARRLSSKGGGHSIGLKYATSRTVLSFGTDSQFEAWWRVFAKYLPTVTNRGARSSILSDGSSPALGESARLLPPDTKQKPRLSLLSPMYPLVQSLQGRSSAPFLPSAHVHSLDDRAAFPYSLPALQAHSFVVRHSQDVTPHSEFEAESFADISLGGPVRFSGALSPRSIALGTFGQAISRSHANSISLTRSHANSISLTRPQRSNTIDIAFPPSVASPNKKSARKSLHSNEYRSRFTSPKR